MFEVKAALKPLVFSTLENLVKGGRIGRVTGLLVTLNIRVVMQK